MMGSVTASCGHKLGVGEDGVDVIYSGESCDAMEGFSPCLVYAHFCQACADSWRQDGLLFKDHEDADAWLQMQPRRL